METEAVAYAAKHKSYSSSENGRGSLNEQGTKLGGERRKLKPANVLLFW